MIAVLPFHDLNTRWVDKREGEPEDWRVWGTLIYLDPISSGVFLFPPNYVKEFRWNI